MSLAIKIENVSKQYRLGEVGTGTLIDDLNRWWYRVRGKEDPYLKVTETNDRTRESSKNSKDYVWALQDIDLEVQEGEVLGIIGRNGAGKSTLLKILSRITTPTTGSIKVNGRIGSLLEVGTGFHPDLTGRENIYLNGAILGMRRHEVTQQLDAIVDFSGCAKYLDTPVKRYSSGMMVRLGFAVAAHLQCEILIVDEVLAVGDSDFQKRCIGKIDEISNQFGRTILLVSHQLPTIRSTCSRAVLLKNGTVESTDSPEKIIARHLQSDSSSTELIRRKKKGDSILKVSVFGETSQREIHSGYPVTIAVSFSLSQQSKNYKVGIGINSETGERLATLHTDLDESFYWNPNPGLEEVVCSIAKWPFKPGNYFLDIGLSDSGTISDYSKSELMITVAPSDYYENGGRYFNGHCLLDHKWSSSKSTSVE